MDHTVTLEDLLALAAHESIKHFDSDQVSLHINDVDGWLDDVTGQFNDLFRVELLAAYHRVHREES